MYAVGSPERRLARFNWIGESWQFFTAQAGVWVLSAFIYGLISLTVIYALEFLLMFRFMLPAMGFPGAPPPTDPTAVFRTMMPRMFGIGMLIGLVGMALNAYFFGGLLKMANKQLRGLPIYVGDLFSGRSTFWQLALYQLILYVPILLLSSAVMMPMMSHLSVSPTNPFAGMQQIFLMDAAGLAIDIIPIILLGLFWPAAALIADGEPALSALGKSWDAMKGQWLMSSLIVFVFLLLMFATAMLCLIPLLATGPMFMLLSSLMYRDMIGMPQAQAWTGTQYYPPSNYPPATPGAWPPPPTQNPPPPPPAT